MGAVTSVSITANAIAEEDLLWQERKDEFEELFQMFRDWHITDVEYAIKKYIAKNGALVGKMLDGQKKHDIYLDKTLKWKDYFELVQEVDDHHIKNEEEAERLTWHPAAQGYPMYRDRESEQELADYLGEPYLPPLENYEIPEYTDDEESDIEDEYQPGTPRSLYSSAPPSARDGDTGHLPEGQETGRSSSLVSSQGGSRLVSVSEEPGKLDDADEEKVSFQGSEEDLDRYEEKSEDSAEEKSEDSRRGSEGSNGGSRRHTQESTASAASRPDSADYSGQRDRPMPLRWDPEMISPVFFGCALKSVAPETVADSVTPIFTADIAVSKEDILREMQQPLEIESSETGEETMGTENREDETQGSTKSERTKTSTKDPETSERSGFTLPELFAVITLQDVEDSEQQEKEVRDQKEQDALNRRAQDRNAALEQLVEKFHDLREVRANKVAKMRQEQERLKEERAKKLEIAQEQLQGAELQAYERQWRTDEKIITDTENEELTQLIKKYELKNNDQKAKIKEMEVAIAKAELDEAGNAPTGRSLEAACRTECREANAAVDRCRREIEECQRKLVDTKRELKEQEKEKKGNKSAQQTIRAMIIQLEGEIATAERELEDALEASDAAELLLERAMRIRAQEDAALPLFEPLSDLDDNIGVPVVRLFDVLSAFCVVCDDALSEKLRLLTEIFDFDENGFLNKDELFNLFQSVATVLEAFELVNNVTAYDDEIESVVLRAVYVMGGDDIMGLTRYEVKQWAASTVSRKRALCELFGADWTYGEMGIFQRQRMGVVHQAELGIITNVDLKYAVARAVYTFRPVLMPDNKLNIHDRAMAMGQDDPLKPDYSRFLPTKQRLFYSNVVPLEHGHLGSLEYHRRQIAERAALRLQKVFRGNRARKQAEFRAMKQAFLEAKQIALDDVQQKVEEDFAQKENLPTVEKLKWDASVRKRQAKLRANGQIMDRNEVVQLMLQDAIADAQSEVEKRFQEIAVERKFNKEDYYDETPRPETPPEEDAPPEYIEKRGETLAQKLERLKEKLPGRQQSFELQKVETPRGAQRKIEKDLTEEQKLAVARNAAMIQGKFPPELYTTGETLSEQMMRYELQNSEPNMKYMFNRLRMFGRIMTQVKTEELMLEFPSKRLLLQYVSGFKDIMDLADDLAEHFLIDKGQEKVADILKSVLESDLELGVMHNTMLDFQAKQDAGVALTAKKELEAELAWATDTIKKRQRQPPIGDETEEDKWERIRTKDSTIMKKKEEALKEISLQLANVTKKIQRAELELKEWRRRQRALEKGDKKLQGMEVEPEVQSSHRFDWIKRFETAIEASDESPDQMMVKYQEIINVVEDFEAVSRRCAITIINEMYFPDDEKTIKSSSQAEVDGRGNAALRGIDGLRYKYQAYNIRFKFCTDDHGMFNGSDEFAAKGLGGQERIASLQYFKVKQPGLVIPLVCIVDYHGFRMLCVSKMPLGHRRFDDAATLIDKEEKVELVHGTVDRGQKVHNDSKVLSQRLSNISQRLNLAKHSVRGTKDVTTRLLNASVDLRGYREASHPGSRKFFLLNFWRCYPAEYPPAVPHLPESPREQCILYRRLRPEFVRVYDNPLSPDANNVITYNTTDWLEHLEENERATQKLVNEVIPDFAEWVATRDIPPATCSAGDFMTFDLTNNLHQRGINVRHLGLLRTKFWRKLEFKVNIQYHKHRIYPHGDLTKEMERGEQLRINGEYYRISTNPKHEFSATTVTLEERMMHLSANNLDLWVGEVKDDKNSAAVREMILAEMVARTLKNVLRHYMRMAARYTRFPSQQVQTYLTCQMLNVVTGSHELADEFWAEQIFHSLLSRFGYRAISELERPTLRLRLKNSIVYIIRRMTEMLGVFIDSHAIANFYQQPVAFRFDTVDIRQAPIRSKHNVLIQDFAQAMVLSLQARHLQESSYSTIILRDAAVLYLKLHERIGSLLAVNIGSLGHAASGVYTSNCTLEKMGPIMNDEINRAVEFTPGLKTKIDIKYLTDASPAESKKPFAVEVWANLHHGSEDLSRVVLMGGSFSISANRENIWQFSVYVGSAEIPHMGTKVEYDKWTHLVGTFDGMVTRFYIDSRLVDVVELQTEARKIMEKEAQEQEDALQELDTQENQERENCKERTEKEARIFFRTKEGQKRVNDGAKKLLEQNEFKLRMDKAAAEKGLKKLSKRDALQQARQEYLTESYMDSVRKIVKKYKKKKDEIIDRERKVKEDVQYRVSRPLRIGAACASRRSKEGRNFFQGEICHVAVYHYGLSSDQIKRHCFSGNLSRTLEADRLYSLASHHYQICIRRSADDHYVIQKYASAICSYLSFDGFLKQDARRSRARVMEAINIFETDKNLDGLAEILRSLPADENVADLAVMALDGITKHVPTYFRHSEYFNLEELSSIPNKFMLCADGSEQWKLKAAGQIYRLVLSDSALGQIYGDEDLSWAVDLESNNALVSLVLKAQNSDSDPRSLDFSTFPKATDLSDKDAILLANNRRLALIMNFTGCSQLSDVSMRSVVKWCKQLEALNLDHCALVGPPTIRSLMEKNRHINLLSLDGCELLDNELLCDLVETCTRLRTVNLSNNPNVLDTVITTVAKNLPQLELMHVAYCSYITDRGLQGFSLHVNGRTLVSLDLSGNRSIGDDGVSAMAQCCTSLTFLNIKGLNKVTTDGVKCITHNLWKLKYLCIEDLYLVDDTALIFDSIGDGRTAAQYGMLTSVTELNMKDCIKISNLGLKSMAQRAKKIQTLNMSGCHLIATDFAQGFQLEGNINNDQIFEKGSTLVKLDMSFCVQVTDSSLQLLAEVCPRLEWLDLSGCVQISDEGMYSLSTECKNIQTIKVARCRRISDKSLCWLADYLWIEELDVSNCVKISDDGMEVLCLEFSGMQRLTIANCSKISNKSIDIMIEGCPKLKFLDVRGVPLIKKEYHEKLRRHIPRLDMITDENPPKTEQGTKTVTKQVSMAFSYSNNNNNDSSA